MVTSLIEFDDISISKTQIRVNNQPVQVLQFVEHRSMIFLMYRHQKHIYSRHFKVDQKTVRLLLDWHGTLLHYRLPKAEKIMIGTCTRQTLVYSDHSLILRMQDTSLQMIGLIQEYFPMQFDVYPQHCHTICPANQNVFESIVQVDHCTTLHLMLRDFYHLFHTQNAAFVVGLLSLNVLGCQFESMLKGLDYPYQFLERLQFVSFGIINQDIEDGYVLKPLFFSGMKLKETLVQLMANDFQMTPLVKQLLDLTRFSFINSDDRYKLYIQNDHFIELNHPKYSDRFDVEYEHVCLSSY
jgi:hypothetical protein